jgi:HEAT repeat protein
MGRSVRLAGLLVLTAAVATGGCSSRYKKLAHGGSPVEAVLYDVVGYERDPGHYYRVVQGCHDECDFRYRCGDDPYVVDKSIDAVQRLGNASFGRLEGQAMTIVLLQETLIEDPSALARASAATSLTKIGLKLPRYPGTPVDDTGERFLALAQELRGLYGGGSGRPATPAAKARAIEVLRQLGDLRAPDVLEAKKWLKETYGRKYLVDERDPEIRAAIDTATVKRSDAVVRLALSAAVEDPAPEVRADAVRGLKTLGEGAAEESVIARLPREPSWLVKLEMAEYLGKMGTAQGVSALLPLLDDPDSSVRHKAQQSLARVAGRDLGFRRRTWELWARQRYPGIRLDGDEAPAETPVSSARFR